MVTDSVATVKAFGVADEGTTAEPQRPQRSEREKIGGSSVRLSAA